MWLQHENRLGSDLKSASAVGVPDLSLVLSATWNHLRRHFFAVMCWAFVLCGLHRVPRLPLGSFVTFARIHCHVGVIFYCSITAECPIFEGLHWSFAWTGNIFTLYRWCKGLHARPPITFFRPCAFCRALRRRCSCDTSCNSLFCQLIPFRLPTKAHIALKGTSNEHLAGENERRAHPVHLNYTTVSLWRRWSRERHSVHCRTVHERLLMSCFSVRLHQLLPFGAVGMDYMIKKKKILLQKHVIDSRWKELQSGTRMESQGEKSSVHAGYLHPHASSDFDWIFFKKNPAE